MVNNDKKRPTDPNLMAGGSLMAPEKDGGILPPPITEAIQHLAKSSSPISLSVPDMSQPGKGIPGVYLQHKFADGGQVDANPPAPKPEDKLPMDKLREFLAKHGSKLSRDVNEAHTADQVDPAGAAAQGYAKGGMTMPSDEEKREMVLKAMQDKTLKLDDGGVVDPNALPADASQDSKLAAIFKAMGFGHTADGAQNVGAASNVLGGVGDALKGALPLAPKVAEGAADAAATPGIAPVINSVVGSNLQEPAAPPMPTPPVAPPPAPMPPAAHPAPAPHMAPATPTPDPLAQLGKFDPTAVAPGMNPGDRQALAGQLNANQHTFGNYLAEAVSGIGDALAARGGVSQNSLGAIIGLQKQQRDEALSNFDKAREIAVQNHTMKNQADQELINNVKARGEMIVSPEIAKSLGHPEWANKPTAQVSLALSAQKNVLDYTNNLMQRKQAALKDAADSVEQALKSGGIGGTQKMMDPKTRLQLIYTTAKNNDPEAFGYTVKKVGE